MIVYKNDWFRVIRKGSNFYVEEPAAHAGAAVLPIWGDAAVLLEMNRVSQGERTLEIPRGYAQMGESVRQCAARELLEETGFFVDPLELVWLGYVRPNTGILRSRVALFAAQIDADLSPVGRDAEANRVVAVPMDELVSNLRNGLIEDSFTLSAIALYSCN